MHVALIVALTVSAQTTSLAQPANEAVKYKRIQVVDFPDDLIDGSREHPEVTAVEVRKAPTFRSLVKVRDNFNDKLLESVHEM